MAAAKSPTTVTRSGGDSLADAVKDGVGSSVMISYCRKDKAFVKALYDALSVDGRQIWVDWADIPPSAEWLDEIHQGARLVSDSVRMRFLTVQQFSSRM
jgi:hypothetical protein